MMLVRYSLYSVNLRLVFYAVSVVYDEDGNGKLNTGFLGIPSDPVGFSNNAKGTFGPPSFYKASFAFPELEKISIILGLAKAYHYDVPN